jgi:hypothetical protein
LTRTTAVGDSLIVKRAAIVLVALSLLLAAGHRAPAAAQGRYMRLDGIVQWIASNKMQLILDSGPSVSIDLTQVPQEQYRGLSQRDRVGVIATLSSDGRQILGLSITRVDPFGYEAP